MMMMTSLLIFRGDVNLEINLLITGAETNVLKLVLTDLKEKSF